MISLLSSKGNKKVKREGGWEVRVGVLNSWKRISINCLFGLEVTCPLRSPITLRGFPPFVPPSFDVVDTAHFNDV